MVTALTVRQWDIPNVDCPTVGQSERRLSDGGTIWTFEAQTWPREVGPRDRSDSVIKLERSRARVHYQKKVGYSGRECPGGRCRRIWWVLLALVTCWLVEKSLTHSINDQKKFMSNFLGRKHWNKVFEFFSKFSLAVSCDLWKSLTIMKLFPAQKTWKRRVWLFSSGKFRHEENSKIFYRVFLGAMLPK